MREIEVGRDYRPRRERDRDRQKREKCKATFGYYFKAKIYMINL